MPRSLSTLLSFSLMLAAPTVASATIPTLRGSAESMLRQNEVAQRNDFTFLKSGAQVERFAEEGHLVRVEETEDYALSNVSYPYARPELVTFIERLSAQYRTACGERLVVTSLMRPVREQPRNAHPLSVHPAGMAVDLRVSQSGDCRSWLEDALLGLEAQGLLDVTRERRPPHYHVAVFPDAYGAYAAARAAEEARAEAVRQDSIAAEEARVRAEAAATATGEAIQAGATRGGGSLSAVLLALLVFVAPWGTRVLRRRARRAFEALDA